jgi:hypothetical protein
MIEDFVRADVSVWRSHTRMQLGFKWDLLFDVLRWDLERDGNGGQRACTL